VAVVTVLPYRATIAELGSELVLLSVSGELDLYVEPDLRASLVSADGMPGSTVIVDLSGVSFLDSRICGVLVGETKRRRASHGDLALVSNGAHTTRALQVAGIDRVIRVFPTLHEALQTLLGGPTR
jgi:anti-sigma B factor antagonist